MPSKLPDSSVPEDEKFNQVSIVASSPPDSKMDGGLIAWLQVLGSWILFMNTWGLTNSFGVFETYYVETLLPESSPSAIAWIGSIQLFLTMIVGIFAGWLLDAGHLRLILLSGTFFEIFGMMMTSLSTKYWQVLLSQAVCTGLGSGLLGLTSVAVIPLYFSSRRMIATGIAATGSSLAGIIYPIMLQHLFRSVGFAWAVRVLAFLMLGCLLISCAIMKLRARPVIKRKPLTLQVFRDFDYSVFIAAFALMILSVYIPFFYIGHYASELGISSDMSFYLLSIMNAASLFGRLAPNYLADKFGGITVMIPSCFLTAVLLFVMRTAHDLPGLVVMSLLYGFISGGMVSLPPAIIANLTKDPSEYGVRIGVGYTVAAIGALVGNPIAGALRSSPGNTTAGVQRAYQFSWIFAGCVMMLCTSLLVIVQLRRRKLNQQ
ncbi:hypothetical protein MBLNU459_g4179t1 [Dothideomycetes sp. NU459]